jgi:type III secretory pathway component EscS
MNDYRRGVGLMIEFIGLLDTARDYTLPFTITYTLLSIVTSLLAVTRQWLSTADVPLPLRSRTILNLKYHLLTTRAHND